MKQQGALLTMDAVIKAQNDEGITVRCDAVSYAATIMGSTSLDFKLDTRAFGGLPGDKIRIMVERV